MANEENKEIEARKRINYFLIREAGHVVLQERKKMGETEEFEMITRLSHTTYQKIVDDGLITKKAMNEIQTAFGVSKDILDGTVYIQLPGKNQNQSEEIYQAYLKARDQTKDSAMTKNECKWRVDQLVKANAQQGNGNAAQLVLSKEKLEKAKEEWKKASGEVDKQVKQVNECLKMAFAQKCKGTDPSLYRIWYRFRYGKPYIEQNDPLQLQASYMRELDWERLAGMDENKLKEYKQVLADHIAIVSSVLVYKKHHK